MTVRLKFHREWRAYRAAEVYDVPKPLADILISRGFAVVNKTRKTKATSKKRKPADGSNSNP